MHQREEGGTGRYQVKRCVCAWEVLSVLLYGYRGVNTSVNQRGRGFRHLARDLTNSPLASLV